MEACYRVLQPKADAMSRCFEPVAAHYPRPNIDPNLTAAARRRAEELGDQRITRVHATEWLKFDPVSVQEFPTELDPIKKIRGTPDVEDEGNIFDRTDWPPQEPALTTGQP
jgi:hypothetical protein